MYTLYKTLEISAAHQLNLDYTSKCSNLHGHNWLVTIVCKVKDDGLDQNGMVVDFSKIKEIVNRLDHAYLNNIIEQPTAENIAVYLHDEIPHCVRVEIEETKGNKVVLVLLMTYFA